MELTKLPSESATVTMTIRVTPSFHRALLTIVEEKRAAGDPKASQARELVLGALKANPRLQALALANLEADHA